MSRFEDRRNKLRRLLKKSGSKALLVTSFVNVTYLTGFTGDDSYLLVSDRGAWMLSDFRYTQQLQEECPGLDSEIRQVGTTMVQLVSKLVNRLKLQELAVEADCITLALHDQFAKHLSKQTLVPTSGLVEQLREIKDKQEVTDLRRAVDYAERAFAVIRAALRPEQTEREIAFAIEHQIRQFGGRGCSFPPIVAVGARAALPHAHPTEQRLDASPFVLIDWGACERLYMSDLTRVLVTGKIPPKLERVYEVVLTAQKQAIAAIRPGVPLQEVDAAARGVIHEAGYGKQFGHGLGHGVGLEIHEAPRLAANQRRSLKAGMVVTVEPGIYLPHWGGVRIEDDVLVTRNGHELLTHVPKEFGDCVVH